MNLTNLDQLASADKRSRKSIFDFHWMITKWALMMRFSCQIFYHTSELMVMSLTVIWLAMTLVNELGLFAFRFRIWHIRWWEEEEKAWRGKQTEKKQKKKRKKKLACQGNEWCLWPCAFLQNHVAIYYLLFIAFKLKGLCHLLLIFMSLRSNWNQAPLSTIVQNKKCP